MKASILFTVSLLIASGAAAQTAPPLLQPDARYKADLLLIVAHPDDDVLLGGYLARISLDERKRVAVVYCTNGDGGGNAVGNEAGASLGQLRVLEARRALASLGIENVWFLTGHDTPGQNVLRSLDHWNHGLALDEVVRLVRITRPEVILTWLPSHDVGENHDDHQASGVLATEAFDAAGDPTVFPEQVSPAEDRTGMANLTEGLLPWQPKKIYYFTDAFEVFSPYWSDKSELPSHRANLAEGRGPTYDTVTISPTRHLSYAHLEAEQQGYYLTQEGDIGISALKNGNFRDFEFPIHLILGKSLVGGTVPGDVFEGVSDAPAPFARVRGYQPDAMSGLSLEIGDPWHFYGLWWTAHNLDNLAAMVQEPEISAKSGDKLSIPMLACNRTGQPAEISISSALAAGWTDKTLFTHYPVRAGECYPLQALVQVQASASGTAHWQQITWTAASAGHTIGTLALRIYVGRTGGLPQ